MSICLRLPTYYAQHTITLMIYRTDVFEKAPQCIAPGEVDLTFTGVRLEGITSSIAQLAILQPAPQRSELHEELDKVLRTKLSANDALNQPEVNRLAGHCHYRGRAGHEPSRRLNTALHLLNQVRVRRLAKVGLNGTRQKFEKQLAVVSDSIQPLTILADYPENSDTLPIYRSLDPTALPEYGFKDLTYDLRAAWNIIRT